MSEYSDLKKGFRINYESGDQSRGMFYLDDLGPSFDDDPLFALQVSLALATIEAELYPTLNDGVNYMFYHTYENVDQIVVGEHVETQEELDEMKRHRYYVLNSGKLYYEDAFRDVTDSLSVFILLIFKKGECYVTRIKTSLSSRIYW